MQKLSREEMRNVAGGTGQLTNWKCQDVKNGPYISNACAYADPAGGPNCPEYACMPDGTCSTPTNGCS
jgi:hypothetical protein